MREVYLTFFFLTTMGFFIILKSISSACTKIFILYECWKKLKSADKLLKT